MLLPNELRLMAEAYGDETAYTIVDGDSLTFSEWDSTASRVARGLVAQGIEPGDRVGVQISPPNALRFLISYAAAHRAGAVAVPLNPRLARGEVEIMLAHSGAKGLIADGDQVAAAGTLVAGSTTALRFVVDATHDGSLASPAGTRPVLAGQSAAAPLAAGGGKIISWTDFLDPDPSHFQVPRDESDLADILYTSGTTGRAKGVAVHHGGVSLIPFADLPPWSRTTWLHASPMFTFAGIAFVYNPMKLGMRGLYQARFDAQRWMEVVATERPVAVFLVPAMVHLLLDSPDFAGADLSSIQICAVGSAPLAPFALEKLQEKMPDAMVSSNYGMTEAGSVYAITPKGESVKRPGTVGLIVPPAEVRIVDSDGAEVVTGDEGEVQLRTGGRSREYYNDPEATASTWKAGWLVTGDIGRLDSDGYLYIVGRSKDVIIRGGNNIHAADVEHVIVSHPEVAEAAVVGAPHPVLGEDPVAFVVLKEGSAARWEEIRSYCLDHLADYKVPRRCYFRAELPRNATGKVVKPELKRLVEEASLDGDPAEVGSA